MLRIGFIASLFALFGQSQASQIILKSVEINAVDEKKLDSNCVEMLSLIRGKLQLLQTSVNDLFNGHTRGYIA